MILNYFQTGFAIIFYLNAHLIVVPVPFLLWVITALIGTGHLNSILINIYSGCNDAVNYMEYYFDIFLIIPRAHGYLQDLRYSVDGCVLLKDKSELFSMTRWRGCH